MKPYRKEVVVEKMNDGELFKYKNIYHNYKLKKIKVEPYVWHISPKCNRESILMHGLLPIQKELINNQFIYLLFANNFSDDITNMYPIASLIYDDTHYIEIPESENEKSKLVKKFEKMYCPRYDFWRINTKISANDWFIDPNLELDLRITNIGANNPKKYVCTKQKIKPKALDLFAYDGKFSKKNVIKGNNCVLHIVSDQLPLKRVV